MHRAVQGCVSLVVILNIFLNYLKKMQVQVTRYVDGIKLSK